MLKLLSILFVLTSGFAFSDATAQTWASMSDDKAYRYELDTDSIQQITNGEYRVRWRWGQDFERSFSTLTLKVFCDKQKVVTERDVRVDRRMHPTELGKQVSTYDYLAGTSTSAWGSSPITLAERVEAVRYPVSGSPEGRLVRLLCQNEPGFRELHEEVGAKAQESLGCGTDRFARAPICKPDLHTRELLSQMVLRLDQVEDACAIDEKQSNLLGRVWLKQAEECGSSSCDLGLLTMRVEGLGRDIARAENGQPCTSVESNLKSARRDEARDAGANRLRECLNKTIPELDDKTSPANVVAEGVYATCRGVLPDDLIGSAQFAQGVMPSITSQVLRHRNEVKKPARKAR